MIKELKIKRIVNRNTGFEVCPQYLNIPVNDLVAIMGEPLKVRYKNGSFFTHELVEDVEETEVGFVITTTRKVWILDGANEKY